MPGKSLENMHVAVLAGGHSAEREISLNSGTTVVVTVNGDGTFDDGTQTQTLRNRTPIETGADAKGYMEYTLHTLRVTGATGATTFTIATSLDGTGAVTGSNSCRMWFDDLRIERE